MEKKASQGTRKAGSFMASSGRKKMLASLLENEKAVAPLLIFLKATDVGGREGARERELKWERKNDQAGEDLVG